MVVIVLFTAGIPFAYSQQLPPAATPGGVEPDAHVPRPPPEPRDDPEPRLEDEPSPVEGPRTETVQVPVEKFNLSGAVNRPEHGVQVFDLESLLAGALQREDEWSMGDLQRLTESVTAYYADKGFVLTRAYLPPQTVSDGEVEIRVVEGVVGRVLIQGNEKLDDRVIERLMRPIVNEVAPKEEMESALLYAGDLPGLESQAVLQRGTEAGTADLVYRVEDEDRFDVFVNGDNYGSEFVGEKRTRLDLVANDLTGAGDQFVLSGLNSYDPANSYYAGFAYTRPYIRRGSGKPVYWSLSGSHNEYEVGGELEDLGLEGQSSRLDLHLDFPYRRSRFNNRTFSLALVGKESRTFQREVETSTDNLTMLVASHHLTHQNRWLHGGLLTLSTTWTHGFGDFLGSMPPENAPDSSRLGGEGEKAGGEFDKVGAGFSYLQRFTSWLDLGMRLDGQWSDDLLVSLEQFPLGGPDSVRAYPLSAFLVDTGLYASTELSVTLWERLRISAFFDSATGSLNDPLPSDIDSVDLYGAGVEVQLQWPGRFFLKASAAKSVGAIAPGFEEDDDVRIFASLGINLL